MAVLWLRLLTEINRGTEEVPAELLENPETCKALKILEKSAYTEAQLYAYERYWDAVYNERGAIRHGYNQGRAEGRAEGEAKRSIDIARNLKQMGLSVADIIKATGLTAEEIAQL